MKTIKGNEGESFSYGGQTYRIGSWDGQGSHWSTASLSGMRRQWSQMSNNSTRPYKRRPYGDYGPVAHNSLQPVLSKATYIFTVRCR